MKEKNTKAKDLSSNLMKMGIYLIALAFLIFALLVLIAIVPAVFKGKSDFEITDAKGYDFGAGIAETGANLTYKGSRPVNVSYYYEFYRSDWGFANQTVNIGIMNKGDMVEIGFYGYVTWCEIIYDGQKTKLTFTPKRITLP